MPDGKVIIDVDLNRKNADKSVKELDSKLRGLEGSGGKGALGIGKIVTGLGLVKVASAAITTLEKSLDGAITRYDTMNNFPKIMKQLGFSTEESAAAVDKLAEGVTGLPTPLNEIVSSAQGLAVMTGDLDGATDTALALNNAFLASGSSSADASRGLNQYVQMLAKGEVDMQSWRTLQETMGLALNETAKAFGFTGKAAQNDLYAALQDGSITFDQFNDKIIELDSGVNGFAKRARTASGGIATAFSNMRTAAVRGLEGIIRSIDEALAAVNLPSIQEVIENVGKGFENVLKSVASSIPPAVKYIKDMIDTLKPFAPIIAGVVAAILTFATGITVIDNVIKSVDLLKGAFDILNDVMSKNIYVLVIAALIGLGVALYTAYQNSETFRNKMNEIWTSISTFLTPIIQSIASFITTTWTTLLEWWNANQEGIKNSLMNAWNSMSAFLMPIIQILIDFVMASFGILVEWWNQNQQTILNTATTVWTAIQSIFGSTISLIVGIVQSGLSSIQSFWDVWGGAIKVAAQVIWSFISNVFMTNLRNILATVTYILNNIKNLFKLSMDVIKNIVKIALSIMKGDWSGVLDGIEGIVSAFKTYIGDTFNNMMEYAKTLVSNGIEGIKGFFDGLKDIDLWAAGEAIIDGFLGGLKSAYENVKDFVGGIADYFIKHKGPISYDKKILIPAGKAIMFGLNKGLQDSFGNVKDTIYGLTNMIDDTFSKELENTTFEVSRQLSKSVTFDMNLNTAMANKAMNSLNDKIIMPQISAEAALGIGGRMSTSPNSVSTSSTTNNNYTTAKDDNEVVRLLKVIANKPFLAELDGKRVTKAISQEMDKSQGNRIKMSDWGIEIDG